MTLGLRRKSRVGTVESLRTEVVRREAGVSWGQGACFAKQSEEGMLLQAV